MATHPMAVKQSPLPLQPPFKKSVIQTISIPVVYQDERYLCRKTHGTKGSLVAFLKHDLNVSRLTDIEPFLWLAGMRKAARPLHRQTMINRKVIVTEQADLHLIWRGSRIYIKPLPNYLLNVDFWKENICSCDSDLFESAKGFLLSYIWLVPGESDFQMAIDNSDHPRLLPDGFGYKQWCDFVDDFLTRVDLNDIKQINPRYRFGELRLNRLNNIYRLAWAKFGTKYFIRGYLYDYHDYATFLERNFTWIVTVFGYIAIVLTAMQVGLATDSLITNRSFQDASYGFTVFSIISPLVAIGVMLLMVFVSAVGHLTNAATHERRYIKSGRHSV